MRRSADARGSRRIVGRCGHDERVHRRRSAAPNRRCWHGCSAARKSALLLCLLLVIAFFSFTAENFFSVRNMTNVLGQASLALIAGIGCAIVFISGEVDISIGSLLGGDRAAADRHHEQHRVAGARRRRRAAVRPDHRRRERLSHRLCRHQFADRDAGHDVHHARRRLSLHRPARDPRRHRCSTASSRCRTAGCSASFPMRR